MNLPQIFLHAPLGGPVAELTESFRMAMHRVAATVTIVTTGENGVRCGMTATAITPVSVDPPSVLACINRSAGLHTFPIANEKFFVNVLHGDQASHASAFSGGLDGDARFGVGRWEVDADGTPYLVDAQANLFCHKVGVIPHASHTIFLGQVCEVRMLDPVAPLVYSDGGYVTTDGRRLG